MTERDQGDQPREEESADDVLMRALRLLGEMTAVVIEQRIKGDKI